MEYHYFLQRALHPTGISFFIWFKKTGQNQGKSGLFWQTLGQRFLTSKLGCEEQLVAMVELPALQVLEVGLPSHLSFILSDR
jgi:hypothetical protein